MVRPWHHFKTMVETIAYDKINTILMILCFLIPLSCFLAFQNEDDGYTVNGFDAIESRYQWLNQYHGQLDQDHFEMILTTTMVDINHQDYALMDIIESIRVAKAEGDFVGIDAKDVLLNLTRFNINSFVELLIERFMDEDLSITLPYGLTIDESEGLMALLSDHLSIFIMLCACCLLIIARSIDHLHLEHDIALERSYPNGFNHHIHLLLYHFSYGLIMMLYGWIILLVIYAIIYHGFGIHTSFVLYSGTLQMAFNSVDIMEAFGLIMIHDVFLFMVSIGLTILIAMRFNGFISWILTCLIMMVIFMVFESYSFESNLFAMMFLVVILNFDYLYFPFSYGLTIGILIVEWIVVMLILLTVIKRGYHHIG